MLRVLVQMAMTNHASLAACAVRLLIQHFSQRKGMVDGLKQVCFSMSLSVCLHLLSVHLSVSITVDLSVVKPERCVKNWPQLALSHSSVAEE